MSSSPIIVRPLATPAERELHFELAYQAFFPNPSQIGARHWQQFVTAFPEYRSESMRGAFQDGKQLGSYVLYERVLRVGIARIPIGCVAAVITYPAYRNQGVATLMMRDAISYALSQHYALLLLDGIPKFYSRFGYSDVFDQTIQDIERSAILSQPSSTYTVRPAALEDAENILALYDRHYGSYTGSFTRTVQQQAHRLRYRSPDNPLMLSIGPEGHTQGYLSLRDGADRLQVSEMAADNWPAGLALLQYHARSLDGIDSPTSLRYRLPLDSELLIWIVEHLEATNTSHWQTTAEEGVVHSQTFHHVNAGWMARTIHLPTLILSMLPEWQARWKRALSQWSGEISLVVGEEVHTLHIEGTELKLVSASLNRANIVQFSPQSFVQVVFGYRPISWAACESKQFSKNTVLSLLNVLFVSGQTWIPASDWF